MKKTILILSTVLAIGCTATRKMPTQPIKLKVTHVMRSGNWAEVWGKHGRTRYMAQFDNLHDSVKAGIVLEVLPFQGEIRDTNMCHIFKPIK